MTIQEFIIYDGKKYYLLFRNKDGKLWISNEIGEGMETSNEKLFNVIDRFFKKEM